MPASSLLATTTSSITDDNLIYPTIRDRIIRPSLRDRIRSSLPLAVHAFSTEAPLKATLKDEDLITIGSPIINIYPLPETYSRKYHLNENIYQIIASAATFSTLEDGQNYDYYHISIDGQFTPNPILSTRTYLGAKHPILASSYTVAAYPVFAVQDGAGRPALLDNGAITVFDYAPEQNKGKTTVNNTISYGIQGAVGWQTNTTGNANLSISHSRSRDVEDVSIDPTIGIANKAQWAFKMNNLTAQREGGNEQARTTFKPSMQWVWRVDHRRALEAGMYNHPEKPMTAGIRPPYFSFQVNVKAGFRKVYKIFLHDHQCSEDSFDVLSHVFSFKVPQPVQPDQAPTIVSLGSKNLKS